MLSLPHTVSAQVYHSKEKNDAYKPVSDYDGEKFRMSLNPFYNFDEGEYRKKPVCPQDMRMSGCLKGAAEQNLQADAAQAAIMPPNLVHTPICLEGTDKKKLGTAALDKLLELGNVQQSSLAEEMGTVQGVQPAECMRAKTTKIFSPLDLSKWYLTSPISPEREDEYYQGFAYRGERNPIHNRMRMLRPTETMQVGCAQELMVKDRGKSEVDPLDPVWMRRELDNCTNQYILQQARFIRDPDDPAGNYFGVNAGLCQPLFLVEPPTRHELYEYVPSSYIAIAWIKLLVDHKYVKNMGDNGKSEAPKEPNYYENTRVEITKQVPLPDDEFGAILVPDLAEQTPVNLHFEKILDPSHPFSPRWDFNTTDRSFSPGTVIYTQNPVNSVRCSDVVPVDLLNFRKHMFNEWVPRKIMFNLVCFLDRRPWGCYNVIWKPFCSRDRACCSTVWNIADPVRRVPFFGRAISTLACGVPMREVCNYMARPLTPINTLKMRSKVIGNAFPEGVPEGYSFSEYFGIHKPYMRCWDTNTECGEISQTHNISVKYSGKYDFVYNPNSFLGSQYAIVGAGREGESCTIGGGKGEGGVANPDPISSWMELKLYYARSMRMGIKCIGHHEKLFKPGTGEEILLSNLGASPQIRTKDDKGNETRYRTIPFNYGWRGYVSDPYIKQRFPNLGGSGPIRQGLDQAVPGEIVIYDQDIVMKPGEEKQWRNPYVAFVRGGVNERFRSEIQNPATRDSLDPQYDYIKLIAFNHGKFLDSCGNTDDLGLGPEFTVYKSALPSPYPEHLQALGEKGKDYTDQCDDPRLSACIEPLWDEVKRIYLSEHNRNK